MRELTGALGELSEVVPLLTPHKNKTTHRQLMVSPTTLLDLSTASDKRTYLQSILKQIVGSTQRKTDLLKAGGVERYAQYSIMIRE